MVEPSGPRANWAKAVLFSSLCLWRTWTLRNGSTVRPKDGNACHQTAPFQQPYIKVRFRKVAHDLSFGLTPDIPKFMKAGMPRRCPGRQLLMGDPRSKASSARQSLRREDVRQSIQFRARLSCGA